MITHKLLKEVRERIGESQTTFAKRFGVDQATVSRWEAFGLPFKGTTYVLVERILSELGEEV